MLYIARLTSSVEIRNVSTYTGGASQPIATLTNFNPARSSTSSNNLLAYRPSFSGLHSSNLGAFFFNLDGIFPCFNSPSGSGPICSLFTHEEDGFRNGRAVINAADVGNNFPVFGSASQRIATFGFAFSGCSQMTLSCFGLSTEYSVVCLLPRSRCG